MVSTQNFDRFLQLKTLKKDFENDMVMNFFEVCVTSLNVFKPQIVFQTVLAKSEVWWVLYGGLSPSWMICYFFLTFPF